MSSSPQQAFSLDPEFVSAPTSSRRPLGLPIAFVVALAAVLFVTACDPDRASAIRPVSRAEAPALGMTLSEDASFASFDMSLHVDSGDVDAGSGLSGERVIHVEHRRESDGSWSSRTQFSSLPGSSAADRPSVIVDRSGMRVYSREGRLLSAKRLADLPMPSNIRRFAAENADRGPTLPQLRRPPAAARAPYLGSPIEQLVVRRSTARTRHEALESRLGVHPSPDGAALRYVARVKGANIEIASDSGTGAILAEILHGDDGSVRETTHSYTVLPGGDFVRSSSRTALSVPGLPRRVVTTRIANLVIR